MPSANNTSNSSNLSTSNTQFNISQEVGSRLIFSLYGTGFTGGDVIRYNTVTPLGFTYSCADSAVHSEVLGVVESRNTDNSVNVVLYGSIKLNTASLMDLGGGSIYFLSDTTPGKLQNTHPTVIGKIVKPVYQIAPNGVDSTGVIMNYVGYTIVQGA